MRGRSRAALNAYSCAPLSSSSERSAAAEGGLTHSLSQSRRDGDGSEAHGLRRHTVFADACLRGLNGEKDVVECAYVESFRPLMHIVHA